MSDSVAHAKAKQKNYQQLLAPAQSHPANKSCAPIILCKSFLFLLFLVVIPLFPSQPPNFINHTIFTKFWDLLHLLFIGLAVSYGLFSRINVDKGFDFDQFESNSHHHDSQPSHVSRYFHVSSIFEDGYQNPCASGEYQRDDQSVLTVLTNDQRSKTGSLDPQNVSFEHDANHVLQAWNSQYFLGESMVVVSDANYAPDEFGFRPLGLPVRSLNSRIGNPDGAQFSDGSEASSSLKTSSSSSERCMNHQNFDDMGPLNLEKQFNETVVLPSQTQTPWRSMSGRMEMKENIDSVARHFRPLSVDETQFESLKSQSFRSTTSFSSQASSLSYSPTGLSPSHSIASELPNSNLEELGKQKGYPPASQSPSTTLKVGAPLNAFHLRRYSSGSLFQKDSRGKSKSQSKDLGGNRRGDSLGSREKGLDSLKSDKKPATLVKASSRGKSVRTIRASGYIAEAAKAAEMSKNPIDEGVGKTCGESKGENEGENEVKKGGLDSLATGTNKKQPDSQSHPHMPMPTFAKYQGRENEECQEKVTRESGADSESEIDSFQGSLDEDAVAELSEVDKKASEFIAKFREQIRLQKVSSIERSRGMRISGNYFR